MKFGITRIALAVILFTECLIGVWKPVNAAVGRSDGQFTVSPTGAATYSIPVKIPQAPRGVQPQLTVSYNSTAGDGVLGVGWSLGGLSAVTRCPATVAQDGAAAGIKLTTEDKFCIDGNRLRLVSGTYGASSSIYQTELESFVKITAYGTSGNGPAYFIVQGKDGLSYEYGKSSDSRITPTYPTNDVSTPYKWLLNKVSDRSGNSYSVSYGVGSGASGDAVPVSIGYVATGAGSSSYKYLISFVYSSRSAQNSNTTKTSISGYVSGVYVTNSNLLTRIDVSTAYGYLIRKINIGYQSGMASTRARVSSITECAGSSGDDCLQPTNISYASESPGVAANGSSAANSTDINFVVAGDINGDKREDIVYKNGTTLYALISTASGFSSPISLGVSTDKKPVLADTIGSGKKDVVVIVSGVFYRYYWNGASFSAQSTGVSVPSNQVSFGFVDINGDGFPDLVSFCYSSSYTSSSGTIYTQLNTSIAGGNNLSFSANRITAWYSTTTNTSYWWYSFNFYFGGENSSNIKFMDFNGDGLQDIAFHYETWWWSYLSQLWLYQGYGDAVLLSNGSTFSSKSQGVSWTPYSAYRGWHDLRMVNSNSDKCTDLVSGGVLYRSICDGTYKGLSSTVPVASGNEIDWNGDGISDSLTLATYNASYLTLSIYNSEGTIPTTSLTGIPASGYYFSFDKDGDGQADVGKWTATSISYYLHNNAGSPPDTVSSIVDGYGVGYSLQFSSIANSSVHTTGTGFSSTEKSAEEPLYVVSSVSVSDGIGGSYIKNYAYTGASEDIRGRGFLGFQSITVTDSRTNAPVVKTYYKTAFPYTGMVYQQDVYQNNGTTLVSRTVNTPSVMNLETAANNQRYFPYVSSTTTDTYEVGGTKNGAWITSSTASFNYDSYGNVTSSTSSTTDKDSSAPVSPTYGTTWTKVVTNTISPDTGNWCLGLPSQTTVQQSATGVAAITRTTSFTPDYVNCRVTGSVVEPSSTVYKVTTSYGFDAFGNVNSVSVTGKKPDGTDMATRTTTTNWGTTGQFPINSTNAEGHYTQAGYDDNLGLQTSVTDANGIRTSWSYDNFGRKTSEVRSDGTYSNYSYNECAEVIGGCQNGDPTSSATSINKMVIIARHYSIVYSLIRDEWTYLDQLGRTIVTKSKSLSGGYTRVGLQYNALGQAYRQTAPCDAASCAVYWTTNTYDALGRITASSRPISASNSALQTTSVAYQGLTMVTTDPQSKTKTQVTDPNGWLRKSMDHNGYYQAFTYDAFGSLKTVTDSSANVLFSANYGYGVSAFQTQTSDMDLGTWSYTVNALGEVTTYTDAKSQVFTMTYDKLSRPLTRYVSGEGTSTWTWGNDAASYNKGQLQSVTSTGGTTEAYTYDSKSRLSQKDITADGTTYSYNYAYNTQGTLDTLTYPTSTSGYRLALKYQYTNGMLQQVKDNNAGTIFWQVNTMNSRGEITQETLGNGIVTNRSFDAVTGWLNSIQSGAGGGTGAQNESYLFDKVGNVTQRQNNTLGLTESFYYDNLYRLDYSQLNGTTNLDLTYDALGRITNRSDVASNATWTYDTSKKHAVTQAGNASFTYTYDNNGNAITRNGQSITWSKYNYPTVINNSASENATISYDANSSRWKQVYVNSGATETTYYLGGLMEKVTDSSGTNYRHYIYAQTNTAAVAIMSRQSSGTNATYYVLDDHQQSPSNLRDASGNLVVNESYTAYGNRRSWSTWSGAATGSELTTSAAITRQGYTWQTALGNMGLNHMNGRVQDAITGIFLSADPYISEPLNTQNYNRYGYVYNNPLSLTDPSGFLACGWWDFFTGGTAHAVSAVTSTVSNWFTGGSASNSASSYSGGGSYAGGGGGGSSGGATTLEEVTVTAEKQTRQASVFAGQGIASANRRMAYAEAVEGLTGKPYSLGANGPEAYDCSSTVCFGIRTIYPQFGDYSADQIYRNFVDPISEADLQRGDLIFYDYKSDGRIDHVVSVLSSTSILHPSYGAGELQVKPLNYLDSYTSKQGGSIYYGRINWDKVQP